MQPVLGDDAVKHLSAAWNKMRLQEDKEKSLPITVRTLESLIRLSTAHAKCRLSKEVGIQDCQVAEELVNKALFVEDLKKKKALADAMVKKEEERETEPSQTNVKKEDESQPTKKRK